VGTEQVFRRCVKSEDAYAAGIGSVGMTWVSWLVSRGKPDDS
jgi:hypothetical protein